jgi:ATP-dependent Clp protease ATP-binding subunit ClpC
MPKLGIQIGDLVYGWSQDMDQKQVQKRVAKEKAYDILNGLTFGVHILFLLLFALTLFRQPFSETLELTFWINPSITGLLLSLTVLTSLFLYAHRTQKGKLNHALPTLTGDLPEIQEFDVQAKTVNIGNFMSDTSIESIDRAFDLARKFGHSHVEPLHIFIGTLDSNNVSVVFNRLNLQFEEIKDELSRRLSTRELGKSIDLNDSAHKVLLEAFVETMSHNQDQISDLELFSSAYKNDEFLQELLLDKKVDTKTFDNMVEWLRIHERMRTRYKRFKKAAVYKPTGSMNRAMTSVATPMLDGVSEDLTTAAVSGRLPMLVDRENEIEEIFRVIEGGHQSVILTGPQGVGKTTLIAGIAQLMVEERVPKILQDKRLVRISIPHLVSGASPQQAQQRMLQVFSEVSKSRNIILAITDIDQLLSQGAVGATDLAATLVDFLTRGSTFAIATTTSQLYTSAVERSLLGRVFQKVNVSEPDSTSAIHMLQSKIGSIEYQNKVVFSYDAVDKAVTLSDRYMHEAYLPKKAIEIAQETALQVSKTKGENAMVTGQDVASIISSKTGILATAVQEDEKEKLLTLESRMHGRVIGQDEAVKAVSSALRRARTGLTSTARPIATFLFLGPTGVGKTELAKTVAQSYFGNEDMMIRIDMSEYQDSKSIDRMIGVPGSDKGGLLTEAVRKKPFAIVLLDELEKAHPDILNIFLQVFDDGRLTDAVGRTIDFTNTIIISTSNAGTQYIQDAVARGDDQSTMKTHLMEEELKQVYRPEFLNRFDGIIVFKPLSQEDIEEITKLFMAKVASRLEPKGISFRAEDAAVKELAVKGYDPKFGARPLRRVVQEEVDNAIATALLEGKVQRRDTIVLEAGGEIRIEKAQQL